MVEELLSHDPHVLILEGPAGIGKTVLLSDVYVRCKDRAVLLTITAASAWAYQPAIVRQTLCAELYELLDGTRPDEANAYTDTALQKLYARLQRRATSRRPMLILVDGLHEIPDNDAPLLSRLLSLLPVGVPGIRVVATDSSRRRLLFNPRARVKASPVPGFSADETSKYFGALVPRDRLAEVCRAFKGRPGFFVVIKRLLEAGRTLDSILKDSDTSLDALLQQEWTSFGTFDDEQLRVLAMIAHAQSPMTATELSNILGLEQPYIDTFLEQLPFVTTNSTAGNTLELDSQTQLQFIQRKTARLRREVLDRAIAQLQASPKTWASMGALPRYFQDAGRLDDLIAYLSPELLSHAVESATSLQPISDMLNSGMSAARQRGQHEDAYRFALQTSAVRTLGAASTWTKTVEALIALGDFTQAEELIELVPLSKDKAALLGVIVFAQSNANQQPRMESVARLERLVDDAEAHLSPEEAIDLAHYILPFLPDKATRLVQGASASGAPGDTVDRAIAGLSIQAAHTKFAAQSVESDPSEPVTSIRNHIRDPQLQTLSTRVAASLSAVSADEAVSKAKEIKGNRDKIYFLSQWVAFNWKRRDAVQVTMEVLRLMVATTEYTPNIRDVLAVSRVLPSSEDLQSVQKCLSRIDGMIDDLSERSSTIALCRLRLILAGTIARWNGLDAIVRLETEYLGCDEIADLDTRCESFARILSEIVRIPELPDPDQRRMLLELEDATQSSLEESLTPLLQNTADHYQVLSATVLALAGHRPDLLEHVLSLVNTRPRRDKLRLEAIGRLANTSAGTRPALWAGKVLAAIEGDVAKYEAVMVYWAELGRAAGQKQDPDYELSEELVAALPDIPLPDERATTISTAMRAINSFGSGESQAHLQTLQTQCWSALQLIDDKWEAVSCALDCCIACASFQPEFARKCFEFARQVEHEHLGGRGCSSWLFTVPLRLAIVAHAGLISADAEQDSDVKRLCDLIERVPSTGQRMFLYGEIAVWFAIAGKLDRARSFVDEWILPTIRDTRRTDTGLFIDAFAAAADALFVTRSETAIGMLSAMPQEYRDMLATRVLKVRLDRVPAAEPVRQAVRSESVLSLEDVEEVIALVRLTDADATSWNIIDEVVADIREPKYGRLAGQQMAAVAEQLEALATELYPKPGWIQHEGYKLLCMGAAHYVRTGSLSGQHQVVQRATSISNAADAAFTLAELSRWMKPREAELTLDEAARRAMTIPTEVERASRLSAVAHASTRHGKRIGQKFVDMASHCASTSSNKHVVSVRQSLLDMAYRVDKDYAAGLAERMDSDMARVQARAEKKRAAMKAFLAELQQTQNLLNGQCHEELTPAELERLPEVAWQALASLNARRTSPLGPDALAGVVAVASQLPLSEAYPVMRWVLNNLRRRHGDYQQAVRFIRPFFDASLLVSEFGASTAFARELGNARVTQDTTREGEIVLRPGEEGEGRAFVSQWIASNVGSRLVICDPYFSTADLWVVKSAFEQRPDIDVVILAGRVPSGEGDGTELLMRAWRDLSDQDPPTLEMIICRYADEDKCPVHDRWIITEAAVLKLGTSIGGIGKKLCQCIELDEAKSSSVKEQVARFVAGRERRDAHGRRVVYTSLSL